jgi:hypothetical protein
MSLSDLRRKKAQELIVEMGQSDWRSRKARKSMAETMVFLIPHLNRVNDIFKSCKSCGRFNETFRSNGRPCTDWMKTCDELPEDCWRPVGAVLIWDCERIGCVERYRYGTTRG